MVRKMILLWLALAGAMGLAVPASAQGSPGPLEERAEQVLAMLGGESDPSRMFSANFLAQVPVSQLQAISRQLTDQYGAPKSVRVEPKGPNAGILHIETERGLITMNLSIASEPPHPIEGLVVTGVELRGDSLEAVTGEIGALPGETALAIVRLGDSNALAAHQPDRALAIGSAFKLYVLAELSRQVQAGERHWNDIVSLDERSLPSGMLQNWPKGAPVTLHSLASLMISISDNTATDQLISVLGRRNVEQMMDRIGVASADRNRPFLTTREVFALKTADPEAQSAYLEADEAERRRLLETRYSAVDPAAIDGSRFGAGPLAIDTLEWFVSPSDLVRTMDWFRRSGDDAARSILAISPGGPASLRQDFDYIGFKGGSEPGVINLTWLVRNRAGQWHAVTGSWNNTAAPVDEERFTGLMQRALMLLR